MHRVESDNDRLHPALEWCRVRAAEMDRQACNKGLLQRISQQLQRRIVDWTLMRQGVKLRQAGRRN